MLWSVPCALWKSSKFMVLIIQHFLSLFLDYGLLFFPHSLFNLQTVYSLPSSFCSFLQWSYVFPWNGHTIRLFVKYPETTLASIKFIDNLHSKQAETLCLWHQTLKKLNKIYICIYIYIYIYIYQWKRFKIFHTKRELTEQTNYCTLTF